MIKKIKISALCYFLLSSCTMHSMSLVTSLGLWNWVYVPVSSVVFGFLYTKSQQINRIEKRVGELKEQISSEIATVVKQIQEGSVSTKASIEKLETKLQQTLNNSIDGLMSSFGQEVSKAKSDLQEFIRTQVAGVITPKFEEMKQAVEKNKQELTQQLADTNKKIEISNETIASIANVQATIKDDVANMGTLQKELTVLVNACATKQDVLSVGAQVEGFKSLVQDFSTKFASKEDLKELDNKFSGSIKDLQNEIKLLRAENKDLKTEYEKTYHAVIALTKLVQKQGDQTQEGLDAIQQQNNVKKPVIVHNNLLIQVNPLQQTNNQAYNYSCNNEQMQHMAAIVLKKTSANKE